MTTEKLVRSVSKRFAELRGGRTYKEFAKATGVSRALLHRYESGGGLPGVEALVKLAETEGVSLNWLLFGGKPKLLR